MFLRGFSAYRICLILKPVFRSLEGKGSKIQNCNHDPGFGTCCSKKAKSWRKTSEFMFFLGQKWKDFYVHFTYKKCCAHFLSQIMCLFWQHRPFLPSSTSSLKMRESETFCKGIFLGSGSFNKKKKPALATTTAVTARMAKKQKD